MFLHKEGDVALGNVVVIDSIGVDDKDDTLADDPDGAALENLHLLGEVPLLQLFLQSLLDAVDSGLDGAFVDRDQDMGSEKAHFSLLMLSRMEATFSSSRFP